MFYWYEHKSLRPRQLDRILLSEESPYNYDYFEAMKCQVAQRNSPKSISPLRLLLDYLPLLNIRVNRKYFGREVKSFGAFVLLCRLHIFLDNPYVLAFYNVRAFRFFKTPIKLLLSNSERITCISLACLQTLKIELGEDYVSTLNIDIEYPKVGLPSARSAKELSGDTKFLFIGSQFEIKGGRLVRNLVEKLPQLGPNLTIISNVDSVDKYFLESKGCVVKEPLYEREYLLNELYPSFDVLLLPSFMESFGLVVIEALSCGLITISHDIYALNELCATGSMVVKTNVSKWDGFKANRLFNRNSEFIELVLKESCDENHLLKWANVVEVYLAFSREKLQAIKNEQLKFYNEL